MVERIDDLLSFVAYMALPVELFLSMLLYPRFFLAMPLVARVFGVFLFGFSIFCGSLHFLRAIQRDNEGIAMEVLSWGTAFAALGTAVFLAPNITMFFRSVDEGLREQSNDNAILVQAKRKEEIFRGCLSYKLRNPLYAMEERIQSLELRQQQPQSDDFREALKEVEMLRDSLMNIINASLDPEISTMMLNSKREQSDAFTESSSSVLEATSFLDVRRLIQQAISAINLEREGEKGVITSGDATKYGLLEVPRDEEDPQLELLPLEWQGEVDETTLPHQGVRLHGNVAQVSQILYNLFLYAVAHRGSLDSEPEKLVIKYHLSLVDYKEAAKNAWVSNSSGMKALQVEKGLTPAVLAIRLEGLQENEASLGVLDLSLRVAGDLARRCGGSVRFEPPETATDAKQKKGTIETSIAAHIVVRMEC